MSKADTKLSDLEEVPEMDFSGLEGKEAWATLRSSDGQLVLADLFLEYWEKGRGSWNTHVSELL